MKKILTTCLAAFMLLGSSAAMAMTPNADNRRSVVNGLRVEQRLQARSATRMFQQGGATGIGSLATPARQNAAPARITAGGSNIFGNLWSTTADPVTYGMYALTSTGSELKWEDPIIRQIGLPMQCGWIIDGKLCGYYVVSNYGVLESHYYVEIDFESGALVNAVDLRTDKGFFLSADYNTDDKYIYGYGLSENSLFAFMKAPESDPDNITIIKEFETDEDCLSFTYNRYDQKFYGVNGEGVFVTVDKLGNQTALNSLEGMNTEKFYSGLCYAAKEDVFYWNPQFSDGSSAIYTLDLKTGTKTRVMTCPNSEQYVFFVSPDRRITASTPGEPVIMAISNDGGTLSPSIQIALPTTFANGDPLAGNVSWTALVDGESVKSGEGMSGSTVQVGFDNMEEGMHVFTFYTSKDGADSENVSESFFVGVDTPKAPTDVTLSNTQVTWSAVTAGVNGGYVDLAVLEYEVFLTDMREEEPTPISIGVTQATSIEIPADVAGRLLRTVATVVARSGGKTSVAGSSNEIALGSALKLNVYFEPTKEDFEAMTVIDANNDNRTWSYSIYQECIKSSFTSIGKGPMDDWLILPAIELPSATDSYVFSFDVQTCNSSSPDEFLEVRLGTRPDVASMTTVIMPTFQPTRELAKFDATFSVPEAGNYYIALHTTSAEFQEGLLVSNIAVEKSTLTANGPDVVTDITAEAASEGGLQATVSFNLPSTTHYGAALDSSAVVKATVSCVNTVEVSGTPGQRVSATVETVQGQNTITILPSVGAETGKSSTVEVYTGVEVPSYVANLQSEVSADMLSMTITWDAPVSGVNGGYIDPSAVTYGAYRYYDSIIGAGWELMEDIGTAKSYTYSVASGSVQNQYTVGIVASNVAGRSELVAMADGILGTPYALPMIEEFDTEDANGGLVFECSPWIFYSPTDAYQAKWTVVKMSELFGSGSEGNALVGLGTVANDRGRMGLPRFSTKGAVSPQLTLYVYTGTAAAGLKVLGETYGSTDLVEVGTVTGSSNSVVPVKFTLPETLRDKDWVQLYLEASYPTETAMCIIDAIGVADDPNGGVADVGVSSGGTIKGGVGEVVVDGFEGSEIRVYGIDGRLVVSTSAVSRQHRILVRPGVYVVSAGAAHAKVMVR